MILVYKAVFARSGLFLFTRLKPSDIVVLQGVTK